jgi:hypothetical protein
LGGKINALLLQTLREHIQIDLVHSVYVHVPSPQEKAWRPHTC